MFIETFYVLPVINIFQAVECNHSRCAQLLIENKADTNLRDKHLGNSALHYAAMIGQEGMLLTLLEPDRTDIDIQNKVSCAEYCGLLNICHFCVLSCF